MVVFRGVASGTVVRVHTEGRESIVRQGLQLVIIAEMVVAGVGLVGLVQAGGMRLLLATSRLIVPVLAVLVVLGVLLRMALPRNAAVPAGMLLNPLRVLVLPVTSVARTCTVDVLALTVKDVSGAEFRCAIRGALSSTPPHGAVVDVYGRRTGEHSATVRRLVIPRSGTVITASRPVAAVLVEGLSILIVAGWAAIVTAIAWQFLSTN
jgi:hypothetical protein